MPMQGKIVAVGPGGMVEGNEVKMEVKVGGGMRLEVVEERHGRIENGELRISLELRVS